MTKHIAMRKQPSDRMKATLEILEENSMIKTFVRRYIDIERDTVDWSAILHCLKGGGHGYSLWAAVWMWETHDQVYGGRGCLESTDSTGWVNAFGRHRVERAGAAAAILALMKEEVRRV